MKTGRKVAGACLLALVGVCAAGAAAPAKKAPAAPPALTELDLAKSDQFYLALDPARRVLTLYYHNAILREYTVETAEVGTLAIFFKDAGAPDDWDRHAWESGRVDPPKVEERRELHVTSQGVAVKGEPSVPDEPAVPEPPPDPPRSFELRYAGGFGVEFTSAAPDGVFSRAAGRLGGWMITAARELFGSGEDRIRLRVRLPREDEAALYRSLPPKPGFVIHGTGS